MKYKIAQIARHAQAHLFFYLEAKFNTDLAFEMSSSVIAASQDIMTSKIHWFAGVACFESLINPFDARISEMCGIVGKHVMSY